MIWKLQMCSMPSKTWENYNCLLPNGIMRLSMSMMRLKSFSFKDAIMVLQYQWRDYGPSMSMTWLWSFNVNDVTIVIQCQWRDYDPSVSVRRVLSVYVNDGNTVIQCQWHVYGPSISMTWRWPSMSVTWLLIFHVNESGIVLPYLGLKYGPSILTSQSFHVNHMTMYIDCQWRAYGLSLTVRRAQFSLMPMTPLWSLSLSSSFNVYETS